MNLSRLSLITAALAAVACADSTAPLPNDADIQMEVFFFDHQNSSQPFSQVVTNLCTGEVVELTGTFHFTSTMVQGDVGNEPGDFFALIQIHGNVSDVRGLGLTTGTEYRSYNSDNRIFTLQPPFPTTGLVTFRSALVAVGSEESSTLIITSQVVVNCIGEVVVEKAEFSIVCG